MNKFKELGVVKLMFSLLGLGLAVSIAVNVWYLDYFGLCPPQRLLFKKDAEGLLEPLTFLEAEQNLGTEVRDVVFKLNRHLCEAAGLDRW